MSIESTADKQAYLDTFGVTAIVDGNSIVGIYDDPHLNTLETNTSTPMLMIDISDASDVAYGDSVVIESVSFSGTVTDRQDDGTGMSVLILGSIV